jgi:hypothetical protein
MNDVPGTLDQINARLETLEQRVSVLEHPAEATAPAAAMEGTEPQSIEAVEERAFAQAGGLFSVVGRAMLGIAGAYLLRAVAESTSLPKLAVSAIAIVYALMWLVWAVRAKTDTWVTSAIYTGTSGLILAPMLWELTLSFKVLSPLATAVILAAFVVAATALSWKRDLASVIWVANATAAVAALALSIATHEFIPFIAVLLLMVLICEIAVGLELERSVRPLVAAAADLAVWAQIFIYAGPESARVDYPALGTDALVAPACLLFILCAVGIAVRTAVFGQSITIFETGQVVIAFLLASFGILYFAPHFGAVGLGVVCLILSAACYALVVVAARGPAAERNCQVFAAWGSGLLVAGGLLSLPRFWMTVCVGLAAIACTLIGIRLHRLTLQVHGLLLMVAGSIASGLVGYIFHVLGGAMPFNPDAAVYVASGCALICWVGAMRGTAENWTRQAISLLIAVLSVSTVAAFIVQGVLLLAGLRIVPGVHHIACARTLVLCAMALAVAFAGSRWHRLELTRISYATLAFIAAKLVYEDMRHGHLEFIAASIFLFAVTLIAVPRLARMRQRVDTIGRSAHSI